MGCSSLTLVSLVDLCGLWNLKGISGFQQRSLGLLVDEFDVTNRRGQYLAVFIDYSNVFGCVKTRSFFPGKLIVISVSCFAKPSGQCRG